MTSFITQLLEYGSSFTRFAGAQIGITKGPTLGYDWLVILFVIFVVALIGFSFGRSRLLLGIISIYLGAFLEISFPYFTKVKDIFSNKPEAWLHIGIFFIFSIVVFFVFSNSFLKNKLSMGDSSSIMILAVAILGIGFLTSILVSYLGVKDSVFVPKSLLKYFATKEARFVWVLLPIISIIFTKGRRKYHKHSGEN